MSRPVGLTCPSLTAKSKMIRSVSCFFQQDRQEGGSVDRKRSGEKSRMIRSVSCWNSKQRCRVDPLRTEPEVSRSTRLSAGGSDQCPPATGANRCMDDQHQHGQREGQRPQQHVPRPALCFYQHTYTTAAAAAEQRHSWTAAHLGHFVVAGSKERRGHSREAVVDDAVAGVWERGVQPGCEAVGERPTLVASLPNRKGQREGEV